MEEENENELAKVVIEGHAFLPDLRNFKTIGLLTTELRSFYAPGITMM